MSLSGWFVLRISEKFEYEQSFPFILFSSTDIEIDSLTESESM